MARQNPTTERAVLKQLWGLYSDIVLPLEEKSFFGHFHSPPVTAHEFEARPQVLFVGQYSTGKTSMVKWLTGMNNPHFDIRPQPSTDKFMAVVHGEEERHIHGNAATCLPQLPYQGLASFGSNFLESFQAVVMPADILRDITFVDTPGVLAGSKQRIGRDYDFAKVCSWMADRADLVYLTFDAHKLDISDEFQEVMEVLRPHADKVRCVLNKADQIDAANLVRVYGALLWNVGKVFRTPEVARVFISSFWDEPYRFKDHQTLFDEDKEAVLKELHQLPRTALLRKLNSFVKRLRKVKAHFGVMSHIRSQRPYWLRAIGSEKRFRRWLDDRLDTLVEETQRSLAIVKGDMPEMDRLRAGFRTFENWNQFPPWDADTVARLDRVIDVDIPKLISQVGGVTSVKLACRELPCVEQASPGGGFLVRLGLASNSNNRKRKREDL